MRLPCLLVGLAILVAAAPRAGAQPIAVDPPAAPPASSGPGPIARATDAHGYGGVGGGLAFGRVRANGLDDGWVARLDFEAALLSRPDKLGGYIGYLPAFEFWKAGDDWGLGMPVALEMGVRGPGFRAGLLLGFEAFLVDEVAGDAGFGLYAPLAGLRAQSEWDGWAIGVDGRVERRWQFGADDHTQWQLAVTVSRLWEKPLKEPYK